MVILKMSSYTPLNFLVESPENSVFQNPDEHEFLFCGVVLTN